MDGKQTYVQLAQKYQCSEKTIRRKIDLAPLHSRTQFKPVANIIMDTTYFKRNFGVMVFMNQLDGKVIHIQFVKRENAALYAAGLAEIQKKGINIQSITADGFRGLNVLFPDIPFQLCQFHQQQTIRRYLTRRPKSDAAKALKILSDGIFQTTEVRFRHDLGKWYDTYKDYLNEVSRSEDGRQTWYTHKRLRSAYNSLKRNLPYLFQFEQNRELSMPNTTNPLEGRFTELKTKIRCHSGMGISRKILFIKRFFDI